LISLVDSLDPEMAVDEAGVAVGLLEDLDRPLS
jgi:hypothetical protein